MTVNLGDVILQKSITARDKVIQDLSEHIFELQKQCISKDKDRILSTDATGKNTIETVVEEKLRLVVSYRYVECNINFFHSFFLSFYFSG